ncbi:MAG: ABC-F family ATP-binding cassette domain-containing protein, partial [Leptospiraceae bacterium]|nr:ABC-F family ATP-binding cassette domain-containing protein [Leptospiraceae bacterium]
MLQFIDLHHRFGPNIIFEGLYWHIKPDRKIALIGPNGAGKTTLFQFATEKLKPDGGSVVFSKDTKISLFQQIPDFPEEEPVLSVVLSQNLLYSEYEKKKKQIEELFETIQADSKPYEELLHEQAENEEFAHAHDLHNLEIRARKVLFGLGFSDSSLNQPVKNFSPGYHHRIGLAIALLNPHNLLLLDEPTNHLDDASKEWLAEYLLQSKGTFILVSHDPDFLERTSSTIAEISSNSVTEFEGSLIDYLEEKNEIHEKMK